MSSVFIKVPISERLPKESGGIIGYCDPVDILQQFYFDSKKGIFHDPLDDEETPMRVTIWLEEIELPTEEAARQFANEMAGDGHYNISEIDAFVDGFNYLYEDLKGGNNG